MAEFQKSAAFQGSLMDQESGFIHCSTLAQYPFIIQKFFAKLRPLYLLKIEIDKLQFNKLKFEKNKPGGEAYPHYYSHLTIDMITEIKIIND